MGLSEYRRKRSFGKTPEPRGGRTRKKGAARHFVVQKHDASRLHYDFRLEMGGVLKSWAIPKGPSMNPADKRLAMMVEDHPISYMDFEGEIPRGNYGAGDVIVWDKGLYASSEVSDLSEGYRALESGIERGELKIVLYGEKLKGAFALVAMKGAKEPNAWLLIKERDTYANIEKDVTRAVKSVLTGDTLPRDSKRRV